MKEQMLYPHVVETVEQFFQPSFMAQARQEGIPIGMEKGRQELLVEMVLRMWNNGKSIEEIADVVIAPLHVVAMIVEDNK